MVMPNFIIIGAGRSGTTSLYFYLKQHPEVFLSPVKETNFFAYLALGAEEAHRRRALPWKVKSLDQYQALFRGGENFKMRGEASPIYLSLPGVPDQIRNHLPEVKLLAILRNPIERAYSNYLKYVRDGMETRSFEQAIQDELQFGIEGGYPLIGMGYYVRTGFYAQHLLRYQQAFSGEQIGLFLYEDLVRSPQGLMHAIFAFLQVDPGFVPDTTVRFNQAGVPRNKMISWVNRFKGLTSWLRQRLPARIYLLAQRGYSQIQAGVLETPELSHGTRQFLRDLYAEDIKQVQELVRRDLSSWLQG
jgi:hypothetical protein